MDYRHIGDYIQIYNTNNEVVDLIFAGYFRIKGDRNQIREAFAESNGNIITYENNTLSPDILLFDIKTKEGLQYYNYLVENDLTSTQETYRGFLDYLKYKREIRQNPRDRLNIQRQLLRSQLPFQYEQRYDRVRGTPTISMVPRTMRRRYYGDYPLPDEVRRTGFDMYYWPERNVQKSLNSDDRLETGNLSFEDVQRLRREEKLNDVQAQEYSWVDNPSVLRSNFRYVELNNDLEEDLNRRLGRPRGRRDRRPGRPRGRRDRSLSRSPERRNRSRSLSRSPERR